MRTGDIYMGTKVADRAGARLSGWTTTMYLFLWLSGLSSYGSVLATSSRKGGRPYHTLT